ncbi:hypothetical protein GDI3844 [Gluconacetobacter diazotrophicus PA1 5]|uniref:Uncharacterized protein n=1 Tax=Gluconacetobacter diazotrophicus (strain ATCC 49037 / DSM 5601 / CCUG 37298 / CIP 103539 / LMG 7603 / PAl5) TaxID=272568 RepID=A9HA33_GLUDA|nr:hypothetical protein GDI3844 [Gluconacetobacter diazotrophicus PA1 5]
MHGMAFSFLKKMKRKDPGSFFGPSCIWNAVYKEPRCRPSISEY